jgi:NADH-quinone oxidoreductase subunit J
MDGSVIAFYILGFIAVAAALGMLLSQNAVYSALFLIMNFAVVAVYYLMLGAPFIAMAQVTVYAGAIMVLFLFVIMLLGADKLAGEDTTKWQKPLAWMLVAFFAFAGFYLLGLKGLSSASVNTLTPVVNGSPTDIGFSLFQEYLLPFEVTSILLLVAMVGAIILTKDLVTKKKAADEKGE